MGGHQSTALQERLRKMTETKASDLTIEVRNPADGRVVGEVPDERADAVAAFFVFGHLDLLTG
jgi:acyl-CoA reductase-like NAD-dependent aldehyde dehydrogenase